MNTIHNLAPGDKVKVRSWNSMKNENGEDLLGIKIRDICFVKSMKRYCGEHLTIQTVNCDGSLSLSGGGSWLYKANMLIPENG